MGGGRLADGAAAALRLQGYTVSLVLECCDASLWKVLQRLQGAALSAAATKAVMQQILQALAATHGAGEGAGRAGIWLIAGGGLPAKWF